MASVMQRKFHLPLDEVFFNAGALGRGLKGAWRQGGKKARGVLQYAIEIFV